MPIIIVIATIAFTLIYKAIKYKDVEYKYIKITPIYKDIYVHVSCLVGVILLLGCMLLFRPSTSNLLLTDIIINLCTPTMTLAYGTFLYLGLVGWIPSFIIALFYQVIIFGLVGRFIGSISKARIGGKLFF